MKDELPPNASDMIVPVAGRSGEVEGNECAHQVPEQHVDESTRHAAVIVSPDTEQIGDEVSGTSRKPFARTAAMPRSFGSVVLTLSKIDAL